MKGKRGERLKTRAIISLEKWPPTSGGCDDTPAREEQVDGG